MIPKIVPVDWTTFDVTTCTRCDLSACRKQVVLPQIVENSKILFVGEAPSAEDENFGAPFVGQAGQMLRAALGEVGIDANKCNMMHTVLCKPLGNRPPIDKEIAACNPILDKFILESKPDIIVPLGNIALKRITKRSGINTYNGVVVPSIQYPDIKIVPILSPGAVLRDPRNRPNFMKALQTIKRLLDGEDITRLSEVRVVRDRASFDEMIAELKAAKAFSFDLETSGLNYKSDYIVCMSFATIPGKSWILPWIMGDEAYYAFCETMLVGSKKRDFILDIKKFCNDWRLNHPKFMWDDYVISTMKELFSSQQVKVGHNTKFDVNFLKYAGYTVNNYEDTMLMSYMLDERAGQHSLKDLAVSRTPYGFYEQKLEQCGIKKTQKQRDSYAILPSHILFPYAGTDADVTINIYWQLLAELEKEPKLLSFYRIFLLALSEFLMEVESHGMMPDMPRLVAGEIILNDAINEAYRKIQLIKPRLNPNSPPQLAQYLFVEEKLPQQGLTASGKPCTDEDVLQKLSVLHPVPELIIKAKKLTKMLGTYYTGTRDVIWADGKIHPSFLIHGTETGRLSAKNPNVQNIPRNNELMKVLGISVRDIYQVSDPDEYCMFEVDYSQAELRLTACFTKDPYLYGAFEAGKDPHAMLALRIYRPELIPAMERGEIDAKKVVTKDQRQDGKTANFSLLYGKHWENFANEEGIPKERAKLIFDVYWSTYRRIKEWQMEQTEISRQQGFWETILGRKRRLPWMNSPDRFMRAEAERAGLNFVIQSPASDFTLYSAMLVNEQIKKRKLDARFISFVHDSCIGEVRKTQLNDLVELLHEIMPYPPGIDLKMDIDVKAGRNFGSLHELAKIDNSWTAFIKNENGSIPLENWLKF